MLVESSISVAPHKRLHAPDAKHMPPPSANVRCVWHVELLPSIVEKCADNDDNDNDNDGNNDGDNNSDNDNDNDDDDSSTESSTESSESKDHGEEHEAKVKDSENVAEPSKASCGGSHDADNAHITEEAPTKGKGGTAPSGRGSMVPNNTPRGGSMVPTATSLTPTPMCQLTVASANNTPRGGSAVPTATSLTPTLMRQLTIASANNTPRGGSAVPTATSLAPTPTHQLASANNTPQGGSMVPTATSLAPTPMHQPVPVALTPIAAPPSIGEDSVMPTTDLASVGEGFLFLSFYFLYLHLI